MYTHKYSVVERSGFCSGSADILQQMSWKLNYSACSCLSLKQKMRDVVCWSSHLVQAFSLGM
jgi:hypothetical protein